MTSLSASTTSLSMNFQCCFKFLAREDKRVAEVILHICPILFNLSCFNLYENPQISAASGLRRLLTFVFKMRRLSEGGAFLCKFCTIQVISARGRERPGTCVPGPSANQARIMMFIKEIHFCHEFHETQTMVTTVLNLRPTRRLNRFWNLFVSLLQSSAVSFATIEPTNPMLFSFRFSWSTISSLARRVISEPSPIQRNMKRVMVVGCALRERDFCMIILSFLGNLTPFGLVWMNGVFHVL